MSVSAAQAAAFYDEVVAEGTVWTIRDEGGVPVPSSGSGLRAMPFWSKRSRAERIIESVETYEGFRVQEIPLSEFRARWLPGLARDGHRVGINWSGPRATGYDIEPDEVGARLSA
ncbi:DUF2750 domain-containing protein [Nocardioides sp. NPDC058538]|uniref:DUF2750 domain-containing protein n=1 Tax=Nocardioides sp. NPDC058538 TaxID=3346542 RepID=UPI00364E2A69